jgi:MYXO-CTERM domain-containing protein
MDMKVTSIFPGLLRCLIAVTLAAGVTKALGQGTVTFDAHPYFDGTDYYELGMWFHVAVPFGSPYHDDMGIYPPIYQGVPQSSTPFMVFFRQYNPLDYIILSLTNGGTFGLTSVSLADPTSPSLSPVSISFLGFKMDGSTVTNIFTTPGNGATTFQSYQFGSAFASGLSSVQIEAPRWAMDNLAFTVPEPGVGSLLLLGLLALGGQAAHRRRS